MDSVKKRNKNLEAVRAIACLLIVFVHFHLKGEIGTAVIAVARFGVPFFLITTGYYSYKGSEEANIGYAKKRLVSFLKLTLIGTAVCVSANSLVSFLKGDHPLQWFINTMRMETLVRFLIFNRAGWLSSVMYYLFMMLYVYVIYIAVNRLHILKYMYLLVPVLLFANIYVSKMYGHWFYAGNFLLTGVPFFLLGNYFKYKGQKGSDRLIAASILIGAAGSLLENHIHSDCYCFAGTVFLAIGAFWFGISEEKSYVPEKLAAFGTRYSMLLFLLHCSVGKILVYIAERNEVSLGNFCPFLVILVTILIAAVLLKINEKIGFHV